MRKLCSGAYTQCGAAADYLPTPPPNCDACNLKTVTNSSECFFTLLPSSPKGLPNSRFKTSHAPVCLRERYWQTSTNTINAATSLDKLSAAHSAHVVTLNSFPTNSTTPQRSIESVDFEVHKTRKSLSTVNIFLVG